MMRKLRADWIFDGRRLHAGGVLILEDSGVVADLLLPGDESPAYAEAEYFHGILCPGFINAHCHLELSHMKNRVPKGGGLVDFILQLQRLRRFRGEQVLAAMEGAEKEMLAGGIVAVGDIANSDLSFSMKGDSRLEYHTFLEVFGFDPQRAGEVLDAALTLQSAFASHISRAPHTPFSAPASGAIPSERVSIVPHAPYSVSQALFTLIAEQAAKSAGPVWLSIHNQESAHEDPFYRAGTGDINRLYREFGIDISFYSPYGNGALATWLPWLDCPGKKLLVHNTYTTAEDIAPIAHRADIFWCLCPKANLYIEQRLPDIPLLIENGLKLVLGTDSLASNDSLSILEEMKTISDHFPGIGLEQLLQWATCNGAEFFHWKHLGSFEKGKRPGVNLLSGLDAKRLTKHTRVAPLVPAGLSADGTAGLPADDRGDDPATAL